MQKPARFVRKDESATLLRTLRELRMLVAVLYAERAYLALLFWRELRWIGVYLRAFVLVVGLEMVILKFSATAPAW